MGRLVPATCLVAIVLTIAPGCSFVFTRGPKPGRAECTRSRVAPAIDTVIGVPLMVLGVMGYATAKNSQNAPVPEGPINAAAVGLGAGYALSALVGFGNVRRCRASAALAAREE